MSDDVQHTTLADLDWWYVSRHYETPELAKETYLLANEFAERMKGLAEIAGYRILDDKPEQGGEPRLVVIVGTIERYVHDVAEFMGGEEWVMSPPEVQGLIVRRMRFMVNAFDLDAPSGIYANEYGKGGITLDHLGRVIPRD